MERGKIYSFVGPAGGGKSYAAEEIIGQSKYDGVPCISVDFSDGIRDVVNVMFTGKEAAVDLNNNDYLTWKKCVQDIFTPNGEMVMVDGRTMLKNLGEFLKDKMGNEIWANWALNMLMRKYYDLDLVSRTACNIVFGSLRFDVELQAILKCAELTKKDVEIIYCNYNNVQASLGFIHPSEKLAQSLIKYGFKHRDIITEYLI